MSGTPLRTPAARRQRPSGGPPEEARPRRLDGVTIVIVAATVLGLALRLYQLSRPGYLLGVTEYDDGTDFGSAIRLVHGYLPYRDFIIEIGRAHV